MSLPIKSQLEAKEISFQLQNGARPILYSAAAWLATISIVMFIASNFAFNREGVAYDVNVVASSMYISGLLGCLGAFGMSSAVFQSSSRKLYSQQLIAKLGESYLDVKLQKKPLPTRSQMLFIARQPDGQTQNITAFFSKEVPVDRSVTCIYMLVVTPA